MVWSVAETYSLHDAKAKLSHLVARAESGETVNITRHGKIVARLVGANAVPRTPGSGVGTVLYHGAFDFTNDELDELFHGDFPG